VHGRARVAEGQRPAPSGSVRDLKGICCGLHAYQCPAAWAGDCAARPGPAQQARARVRAGNLKSCLITNCLFRLGGVAALLSNRPGDRHLAKYRLDHVARTHLGADDTAYKRALPDVVQMPSVPARPHAPPAAAAAAACGAAA